MSNGSAQRYAVAARLAVQFPHLIDLIRSGELNLSTLVQMRHHLKPDNVDELLELARGRNRYQVEELLATMAPRPDAPSRMRKLPTPRTGESVAPVERPLQPLSESRYRIQLTVDRELHDDIQHIRDLMRHSNPTGDLEKVFEFCVRAGLERLRGTRLGVVRQRGRRENDRARAPTSTRHIPRAVRRAVFERDGERCTFHSEDGRRCASTTLLDLDHVDPYAVGGLNTVANLRVRCRPHNRLYAERFYGKAYIDERIRERKRKSQSPRASKASTEGPATHVTTNGKSHSHGSATAAERIARAMKSGTARGKAPSPPPV